MAIEFVFPLLNLLPVEILAAILRSLDDDSLMNAALAHTYLTKICRGDPVLRRRIRDYLHKKKQQRRLVVRCPAQAVRVAPTGEPNHGFILETRPMDAWSNRPAPSFGFYGGQRNGGGKMKTKTGKANRKPYRRNLRC